MMDNNKCEFCNKEVKPNSGWCNTIHRYKAKVRRFYVEHQDLGEDYS